MRWIIDERPFRCEDLDGTWWDCLLKGVGLWDSVTGLDARSCGVGWVWGLVRRCCPVPETLDFLTSPFDWVGRSRRMELIALSAISWFSHGIPLMKVDSRAKAILAIREQWSVKHARCHSMATGGYSKGVAVAVVPHGTMELDTRRQGKEHVSSRLVAKSGGKVKVRRRQVQAHWRQRGYGKRSRGEDGQGDQGYSVKKYSVLKEHIWELQRILDGKKASLRKTYKAQTEANDKV